MSKTKDFMLTTYDNPFNPFEDFEAWFKYDLILGHDCCGLLAREANVSVIASDEVNIKEGFDAMNRIVKRWPMIYRMVTKNDF